LEEHLAELEEAKKRAKVLGTSTEEAVDRIHQEDPDTEQELFCSELVAAIYRLHA